MTDERFPQGRAAAIRTERYYAKLARAAEGVRQAQIAVQRNRESYDRAVENAKASNRETWDTESNVVRHRESVAAANRILAKRQAALSKLERDPRRGAFQRELAERSARAKASFDKTGARLDRERQDRTGRISHAHGHANPSHHVGTCDDACRRGWERHEHRERR